MDRSPSPSPGKRGTRWLNGIANTYIRKHLPAEQHASFKAIRALHEGDELADNLPTIATKNVTAPLSSDFVQAIPEIVEVLAPDTDAVPDGKSTAKKHFLNDALYKDVENQKFQLQQAIGQYEKMTSGSPFKSGLDLKGLTTWDDVCTEVDHARERYEDAKGVFANIRKGFSKLGKHQGAVNMWMQLLPSSNEYLSLMCGGLKLVIGAAGRLKEMDDTTVMALTEIPSLLLDTQEVVGVFEASSRLRACAGDLYASILGCINHMVAYFSQKAQKQLLKAFFKQDSYQEEMVESVHVMKMHAELFANAAQGCHYKTSMDTNTGVRALQTTNLETLEKVKYLEGVIKSFLTANAMIDLNTRDLQLPLQSMRRAASSEDMLMLKERARSRKALLDALDTEDSTPVNDISVNLRTAWASSKDIQNRIVALMQDKKLHCWIVTPRSTALFVNGNCSAAAQRSPVSYVSAKLAESIRPQSSKRKTSAQEVISLSFFCSEHTHRKDPDRGPAGMLRNLIAQLLHAYSAFELTTVRKIRSLDYEDIEDLCDIFETLIAQLPAYMIVFIIIDSVGVFEEDKAQRRDARTMMEMLVDLTEAEKEGMCTVKVLATSSWNSTSLYKVFEDEEGDGVVWMPSRVSSKGGLTAEKLEFGKGKESLLLSLAG